MFAENRFGPDGNVVGVRCYDAGQVGERAEFSPSLLQHPPLGLLVTVEGDLLTITADNGTWWYRIVEDWPDGVVAVRTVAPVATDG